MIPPKKIISLSLYRNAWHPSNERMQQTLMLMSCALRAYNTLFFDWKICINVDEFCYNHNKTYFDLMREARIAKIEVRGNKPPARARLRVLNPVAVADYTLCRYANSLPTFKERQAVEIWLQNNTQAHSINDSPNHNQPLITGLIGFKKAAFDLKTIESSRLNYSNTDADSDYLNYYLYPQLNGSITEHRLNGLMPTPGNSFSCNVIYPIPPHSINFGNDDDARKFFENNQLLMRSNGLVNYIGQKGYYLNATYDQQQLKHYEGAATFWLEHGRREFNEKLKRIESKYPDVFLWTNPQCQHYFLPPKQPNFIQPTNNR